MRKRPRVLDVPELADTKSLRRERAFVPNKRPIVPSTARTKLPNARMALKEQARLCSVYLRPWAL